MTKKKKKPQARRDPLALDPEQLYFLPLGGSEEFGVNFNLYAHESQWLAVDCGIGFAGPEFPNVDILLPDPSFIEARRDQLAGLIVTHAHEDHVGAVPYLWPRLQCPVYCTEFTAEVLRRKIKEHKDSKKMPIHTVREGETIEVGPFSGTFVHVAHSIPETCAVLIETKAGRVMHSGDWNLDPKPVVNGPTDEKTLRKMGDEGVLAYIGDSTNAQVPGRAGSERDVEKGLEAVFKECEKGRVIVTMFASNVGRIQSIARAAKKTGRQVCVVGRSLHNMTGAARACGYLMDIPPFLHEEEIDLLLDDEIVIIATGSQGEDRAALARMARGAHTIKINRGDTVVFSSRAIPGNEVTINRVKNNLSASGVNIITPRDTEHTIHVSGHPCQDELKDMYSWIRPKIAVPVHGERLMIEAQADFARDFGVEDVIVPNNGSVIRLGPDVPEIIAHVETGLLAVEPGRVITADHPAVRERRKLQYTGAVHVTLVIDQEEGDVIADPALTLLGLIDPGSKDGRAFEEDLLAEIEDALDSMSPKTLKDAKAVENKIGNEIKRFVRDTLQLKPVTTVHVVGV